MSEKRRLIFSIVQFLNRELSSTDNSHSEDAKESLEVSAGLANLLTLYFTSQPFISSEFYPMAVPIPMADPDEISKGMGGCRGWLVLSGRNGYKKLSAVKFDPALSLF